MVQIAVLEYKKKQELENVKNASAFFLSDIRGFQEATDLQFPDCIAKLAFYCIFGIHFWRFSVII